MMGLLLLLGASYRSLAMHEAAVVRPDSVLVSCYGKIRDSYRRRKIKVQMPQWEVSLLVAGCTTLKKGCCASRSTSTRTRGSSPYSVQ